MKHLSRIVISLLAPAALACGGNVQQGTAVRAPATLDIYFVDVEGGQSTLIVTPAGESLLIDAGFPGEGTFASKPIDPTQARDPQRIMAAVRAAGISRIDFLLLTHFHADHAGGVAELSQLIPIGTFIDHAAPLPEAEAAVRGTQAIYDAYVTLRARHAHLQPRPGDRLPLKGVEAIVVSSAGSILERPLDGAGATNPSCAGTGVAAQEKTENPRSTGVRLAFGQFRFLDVGDLSGSPLFSLACPLNRLGAVDVYLVSHHGGADASDPSLFAATTPRVAIFNNGPRKGAQAETFATLRAHPGVELWQLHRSLNAGVQNAPDERIANLNESTSAWLKLSARADGSFTITNGRTGRTTTYPR